MSTVNAEIKWQGNDDAWFTANASEIFDANIQIFHVDGRYKFTDGITALSALPFRGSGSNYTLTTSEIGSVINGADSATPNDTDLVISVESSVAKKNTWTQIKSFLKTYFDSIYTTTSAVASQITSALSGYVNTGGLTTNYIPKASDSDTLSNSQIIDDGTNVGIYVTPTARLHVKGTDSTFNNYVAKFDNFSDAAIMYLRNDRAAFFYGVVNLDNLTSSQIVETDANKNLISAAKGTAYNKNFGTTSGTVLEGDRITQTITNGVTDKAPSEDAVFDALALKKDTFILLTAASRINPADATTYYMGISAIVPNTTATNFAFKIGYDFRLIGAVITSVTTGIAGTAENNTINFRNITTATSSLISNSVKTNATATASINQTVTGLNITGTSTDDVCIEWITPTWVTNPTTCIIILNLLFEKLS